MSASVRPQDFSEIRWRGHWIWVPEAEDRITPGQHQVIASVGNIAQFLLGEERSHKSGGNE